MRDREEDKGRKRWGSIRSDIFYSLWRSQGTQRWWALDLLFRSQPSAIICGWKQDGIMSPSKLCRGAVIGVCGRGRPTKEERRVRPHCICGIHFCHRAGGGYMKERVVACLFIHSNLFKEKKPETTIMSRQYTEWSYREQSIDGQPLLSSLFCPPLYPRRVSRKRGGTACWVTTIRLVSLNTEENITRGNCYWSLLLRVCANDSVLLFFSSYWCVLRCFEHK